MAGLAGLAEMAGLAGWNGWNGRLDWLAGWTDQLTGKRSVDWEGNQLTGKGIQLTVSKQVGRVR